MTRAKAKIISNLFGALATVLIFGCASHKAAGVASQNSKRILDITIHENSDTLILTIIGSQALTYSAERQPNPPAIWLYFPATTIDHVLGRFVPPENDIVSTIRAGQSIENETPISSVYVALKSDTPCELIPAANGLQVIFTRSPASAGSPNPPSGPAGPQPQSTQHPAPAAGLLRSVTTQALEKSMMINVKADGTINDYQAFTMIHPDRIVFDLYRLKSPHADEQKIAVQSPWVKRIRYFGHPTKLRLVIETQPGYLSQYSSVSTDTGLIIHIGSPE